MWSELKLTDWAQFISAIASLATVILAFLTIKTAESNELNRSSNEIFNMIINRLQSVKQLPVYEDFFATIKDIWRIGNFINPNHPTIHLLVSEVFIISQLYNNYQKIVKKSEIEFNYSESIIFSIYETFGKNLLTVVILSHTVNGYFNINLGKAIYQHLKDIRAVNFDDILNIPPVYLSNSDKVKFAEALELLKE